MKKETIEEAAEKYADFSNDYVPLAFGSKFNETTKRDFIEGAKWQSKRMYDYDELRRIAYNAYCLGQLDEPTEGKYNIWIQQFKKEVR